MILGNSVMAVTGESGLGEYIGTSVHNKALSTSRAEGKLSCPQCFGALQPAVPASPGRPKSASSVVPSLLFYSMVPKFTEM